MQKIDVIVMLVCLEHERSGAGLKLNYLIAACVGNQSSDDQFRPVS